MHAGPSKNNTHTTVMGVHSKGAIKWALCNKSRMPSKRNPIFLGNEMLSICRIGFDSLFGSVLGQTIDC